MRSWLHSSLGKTSGRHAGGAPLALFGMPGSCLADPSSLLGGAPACSEPLAIAGAKALEHLVEFVPVYGTKAVTAGRCIPTQLRIGDLKTQVIGLGNRQVH